MWGKNEKTLMLTFKEKLKLREKLRDHIFHFKMNAGTLFNDHFQRGNHMLSVKTCYLPLKLYLCQRKQKQLAAVRSDQNV